MRQLPIFLDVRGRRALVLGDGETAERKADALRRAGAEVTYHPLPAGHGLSQMDLSLARHWMAGL